MSMVKCGNIQCQKVITDETEVEYSHYLTEYFCNADCAMDRYFDYMQSTPVVTQDMDGNVYFYQGNLYEKDG